MSNYTETLEKQNEELKQLLAKTETELYKANDRNKILDRFLASSSSSKVLLIKKYENGVKYVISGTIEDACEMIDRMKK